MKKSPPKTGLHPRNPFQGRYDLKALVESEPGLVDFFRFNPKGEQTLDFADPAAVQILNRSLLTHNFGIRGWYLPEGHLCPPVPGRLDYLLHLSDLLNQSREGQIGKDDKAHILDIGTGASCIYPLLGHAALGWTFVATDIDPKALDNCSRILNANSGFGEAIELRLQANPKHIFKGIIRPGDRFHACVCNPPFYTGPEEAAAANYRKRTNLRANDPTDNARNFGGHHNELWCEGGEGKFVATMVRESVEFAENVRWFTSLVSKESNLEGIRRALKHAKPSDVKEIPMGQGNKVSRFVAWSFF